LHVGDVVQQRGSVLLVVLEEVEEAAVEVLGFRGEGLGLHAGLVIFDDAEHVGLLEEAEEGEELEEGGEDLWFVVDVEFGGGNVGFEDDREFVQDADATFSC
jgi:hypothetical protein